MGINLEIKDALYYNDMMYTLRCIAGFEQKIDEETEKRIIERLKPIVKQGLFRDYNKLSIFKDELYKIIFVISRKVHIDFNSIFAIGIFPELVTEELIKLENKKNELSTSNNKKNVGLVLKKKRNSSKK